MHACMYVCMHACMCVCMHTYIFSLTLFGCDALVSACHVAATMYGQHLNGEYTVVGRPHCSDPNLHIFVTHDDKYYKMTAVSLANAKASAKPSTPVDKYIESAPNSIKVNDGDTLCKMWDGDGYGTKTSTNGDGYELKDVIVSGCGL